MQNQPPRRAGAPNAPFMLPGQTAGATPYRGADPLDPLRLKSLGTPSPILAPKPPPKPGPAPRARTPEEISHLYEQGLTSAAMSFHEAALEVIREVTQAAPDHAGAWIALAALYRLAGKDGPAANAQSRAEALAATPQTWQKAQGERAPKNLERLDNKIRIQLENMEEDKRADFLRGILFEHPLDVAAMRYLANEEVLADDLMTAGQIFVRALDLSPNYVPARGDYAHVLMVQRNHAEAYLQSEHLLAAAPNNIKYRILRGDAAMHMERFDEAVEILEGVLRIEPRNLVALNLYGNVLKAVGRREDSVRAYRTQLTIDPKAGNAYYGLSELKAKYLTADDVTAMRTLLARGVSDKVQRKCMAYALGQTLERAGEYEESFRAYELGGQSCKEEAGGDKGHDPARFEQRLARLRRVYTKDSLAPHLRPPEKSPATTPLFVLGMPRAGSTLVEQILASHSLVEGTRELPVINNLTKAIALSRAMITSDSYPERVLEFTPQELDAWGAECLRGIAQYRSTNLPYVVDKRPWNWLDIPFIHLILPQARFIDIRRAPMSAGFAMFKQLLPVDAAFSFDLRHTGLYYRAYVGFMDYLDTVLPGRVLRVSYEDLVQDTETQIRRMLDYCGLPFEEGCLRFWETDRAVSTPSAEQVRRPIFRDAMQQWKHYEPWLGPLKEALGDLAEA